MKEVIIGLDGSLRSSGVTVIDLEGNLLDFKVVQPSAKDYNDEDLLEYIRDSLEDYFKTIQEKYTIKFLWYERAAHAANSAVKDKISGSFWVNRIMLKKMNIKWDVVSVGTWRKDLVTPAMRKVWREQGLKLKEVNVKVKMHPLEVLPEDIRKRFDGYCTANKCKKDTVVDLSDSYWIAQWGKNQKI